MSFDQEQIKNLSILLMSADESNASIAFEIIENNEFPTVLLSELFAFFKTAEDKTLKKKAKILLEKYGSYELVEACKMRLPLSRGKSSIAATEKTIKKNIIQYTHNNELDGIKIAKALYQKNGVGATYLLTATPEDQRKEILKTFIRGTAFKLNGKALTQFPKELFDFPELTEIDLSENKITSIPKDIEVFQNLQKLNLSNNKLKSIHKNILKVKRLKNLNLSYNNFLKKYPTLIFEMTQLQMLNIIEVCGSNITFQKLPEEICNLKNLEQFESENSNRPRYANYPSINKVVGSPIDMNPIEIAYAAYDQGDKSPIYYIFKHGSKERILNILNEYYDSSTQTMNLDSIHIEIIPEEIKQFKIKKLSMKDCGLGVYYGSYGITTEVKERKKRRSFARTAILNELTDLEELDLSYNNLCEIIKLDQLKNLRILNLDRNEFGYFPLGLTYLDNLESLYMSNNYPIITDSISQNDFPNELKRLTNLKKFEIGIYKMLNHKELFMEKFKQLIPNCEVKIGY